MSSAHPYTYRLADGREVTKYRAKWTGADGRPGTKRGFERERAALEYAHDREVEARHGIKVGDVVPTGKTTLDAWSKTWLAGLEVRPQTMTAYGYALKRILPALGGRTLAGLRPSEIKAWRRGLVKADGTPLAPATVDATTAVLAMMLRAAVQDGLIDRSPLPPSKGGASRGRVVDPDELLTLEQVRAWRSAMPEIAREMPLVAAMTGLRQGELLGLRLPNVDFLRRQVRVVEQLVSPAGAGRPSFGPPKTAAGMRTVPLPRLAADALARHLERQPAVPGEPVFRAPRHGGRWSRSNFGEVWREAKVEAGLPDWAHWHALRDLYASSLIRRSVDVRTIMTLLGHTSSEETLRTYGRLWPDAVDVARKALDDLWDEGPQGQDSTSTG
jgi:integrase